MCRPSDAVRALLAGCAVAAGTAVPALPALRTLNNPGLAFVARETPALALLREDAPFHPDARSALVHRLLDRFEVDGDKADLREATAWIARGLDEEAAAQLAANECQGPVLRWYWVCAGGE